MDPFCFDNRELFVLLEGQQNHRVRQGARHAFYYLLYVCSAAPYDLLRLRYLDQISIDLCSLQQSLRFAALSSRPRWTLTHVAPLVEASSDTGPQLLLNLFVLSRKISMNSTKMRFSTNHSVGDEPAVGHEYFSFSSSGGPCWNEWFVLCPAGTFTPRDIASSGRRQISLATLLLTTTKEGVTTENQGKNQRQRGKKKPRTRNLETVYTTLVQAMNTVY